MVYLREQYSPLYTLTLLSCNLMTVTSPVIVPVMVIINQPICKSVMNMQVNNMLLVG